MKYPLFTAGVVAAAGILIACGGDGGNAPTSPPPTPVASVTVSPSTATVMVGATTALTATTLDASGHPLSGRAVTWTSSDQTVATVSATGVVTGVAPGSATVTATSEGRSGTAQITVLAPVASVSVTPATATLLVGAAVTLAATVKDAAGNPLAGRQVTWTSASASVATVSPAGVVTAMAPGGPVTITATSEGQSGSAQVTVLAPVASVTVSPANSSVLVGGSTSLIATLRDAAGNVLTGRQVTWSTANAAVATVSATGVVTGMSAGGPIAIAATSEGQTGSAQVTVLAPVASVVFTGSFRNKVGDTYPYTATARLADGTVVDRPMTWSVGEPTRAVMTPDGLMTPLQTGSITIQVTIDGVTWETPSSAYDWLTFGSGTVFGVSLPADVSITNKWGTSEYPKLALGCSGGLFVLFVDTQNFVTENGLVTYGFDNDPLESAVWLEFDLFSALGHPGPDGATRNFAVRMALARKFWFAFTEFNGPAKATMFRVTGLAPYLPAFATCPSAGPAASPTSVADAVAAFQALVPQPAVMTPERALRAQRGPITARAPGLERTSPAATTQEARRRTVPPR